MPATPAQISALVTGNNRLALRADQWRWFAYHWANGRVDDPESFDAEGLQVGDLGYYPVVFEDETVRYLPCMARFAALLVEAFALSPNLIARMTGRRMVDAFAAGGIPTGSLFVLPIVDGAPNVPLTQSFAREIEWDSADRYQLYAIRKPNGLELLLTYDD